MLGLKKASKFEEKKSSFFNIFNISDELYYEHLLSTSIFKEKIVEYIGGFVVKRVLLKTDCDSCISSIRSTTQPHDSLITMCDYGNYFFYPSTFVESLLKTAGKSNKFLIEKKTVCLNHSFLIRL